ncbi:MAG: LysR family transcriptional regulator [Neomegalonema sp.]|nr:LysR family transcriptional regulator [Neomegalonema sp.]
MSRFEQMEVFVAVAEAGGFAKGAQALRISPPAATRAVAALEERLGVRLLQRTTRRMGLTEAGARFLMEAKRILGDVESAELSAAGEAGAPAGRLKITSSATFGRLAVSPLIGGFLDAHAQVSVSLLLLDRVVDLVEEGIDVAVRLGDLPDSSLVSRNVGAVRRILVASPDYLARTSLPEHPGDLKHHRLIGFTGLGGPRGWPVHGPDGAIQIALSPRFEVNDAEAAIAAAVDGEGIAPAMSYVVGRRLTTGALVQVLPEFQPPLQPIRLVYPHARLLAPKVRAFVEWAAPRLRNRIEELTCAAGAPA